MAINIRSIWTHVKNFFGGLAAHPEHEDRSRIGLSIDEKRREDAEHLQHDHEIEIARARSSQGQNTGTLHL